MILVSTCATGKGRAGCYQVATVLYRTGGSTRIFFTMLLSVTALALVLSADESSSVLSTDFIGLIDFLLLFFALSDHRSLVSLGITPNAGSNTKVLCVRFLEMF
jgi:hypothetical protein